MKRRDKKSILIGILSSAVIIISTLVLLSWIFQETVLLNIIKGAPTMKVNTAILFILCGLSVFTLFFENRRSYLINRILSTIIIVVSFVTLLMYLFHFDLPIDNIIVYDRFSNSYPGRMATSTAICFLLTGLALAGYKSPRPIIKQTFAIGLTLVTFIAILAIGTYILQISASSSILVFTTMAIHSALFFLIISFCISLSHPKFSYIGFLTGNYGGSSLARSFLPFAIGLPLILSFILLYNLHVVHAESEFAIAIYTVAYATISFVYVIIISFWVNKTDKKRTALEQSLLALNTEMWQYKFALNESSIISITDANGVIKHVNAKFCELSGFTESEVIGRTHSIVRSGYQSDAFYKNLWKEISAGRVWIGGIKNVSKSGDYFFLHTSIIPFIDEKGDIYQYLSIQQDITKQHRLASQYEALKLRNKEMEQFTYIASHDLQEPLRTLKGISEMLLDNYQSGLDQTATSGLTFISQSVDRMSNLVKALLDYSLIGSKSTPEVVDTAEIIHTVKLDLKEIIKMSGAIINVSESVKLKVYKTEFRLLLQNLISNAIKFQNLGNTPVIEISIESDSSQYRFAIKDNGIGMEEENKREIFSIFRKNHNQKEYDGTGIGLAHCEKIVHLHGGQIWYESQKDQGTVFYFTIAKL